MRRIATCPAAGGVEIAHHVIWGCGEHQKYLQRRRGYLSRMTPELFAFFCLRASVYKFIRCPDMAESALSPVQTPGGESPDHSSQFSPSLKPHKMRTLEEIAQAEDSNDEDYDDHAPGPSTKPKSRSRRSRHHDRPAQKKRSSRKYRGSDIESDDDDNDEDSEDGGAWTAESEDEEVETNDKGRPLRRAAKKIKVYEEASENDSDLKLSSGDESVVATPAKSKKSLIVKLHVTPSATPQPRARSSRNRSVSYGVKQPAMSSAPGGVTRRSSRLSHDEEEPVYALTNSGKHVEVVREGSHEPERHLARATRGGKGIKYPSKSTIDEELESGQPKEDDADELEIKASQHEISESVPQSQVEADGDESFPQVGSDIVEAAANSEPDQDREEMTRGRTARSSAKRKASTPPDDSPQIKRPRRTLRNTARSGGSSQNHRKKAADESSDFDPEEGHNAEEEMSSSSESTHSPLKPSQRSNGSESSNGGRRSTRLRSKATSRQRSPVDDGELAAEIADLKGDEKSRRRAARDEITYEPRGTRRGGKKPNYDLLRGLPAIEDEEEAAPSPSQRGRRPGAGSWQRSLFSTYGPFGGAGGPNPILGGPTVPRAQGAVDSDSSDDEVMKQPKQVGGLAGMTPTAGGTFNVFPQTTNADQPAGTPANLGKIGDKQALADADPLGVDPNVNFDSVGGLQGHIDQLKEMVALPLLYPEIFMRFKITPPRGVLFHGPPGTGKTLLARALASSVSSQGKKVTFYMRKGADALSKWVGEAERQLRLLFEEARKTQPSIIFFDEIDGLAPVRSSKQEQIHASIVSTLLALMDGMDGRGQVIVIGATNRPDSIDPALRRPGRFDREFYFPLPNTEARRAIIDIHTRGWVPPLAATVKDQLARLTKGYGGADLRALCTEAALNAVQRQYPQIYGSNEKLLIDPATIQVTPKDFMISIKKIVPSSERSASSGAASLPEAMEPLLRKSFAEIQNVVSEMLPQKKRVTALEEAQYEDAALGDDFGREHMQQAFESSRVFRPRLLIYGKTGMGQQYLAAALLNYFEGLHVQSFDLPTLLGDTTSSPEATVIRLFSEVKTHKPSVIYIPNVQEWYATVGQTVISTFLGLLRSIKPTDPILLLGFVEAEGNHVDESMRRELFGYFTKNQYCLQQSTFDERRDFFAPLQTYVKTSPSDFPDPTNRKKRVIPVLKPAPPKPEKPPAPPSKEELKAQKKRDKLALNMLKIRLQPIMDQIRIRHKKFRNGVIDESQIRYLYDEADPGTVVSDLPHDMRAAGTFRPFEIGTDAHGVPGLVEQANGRFFYNLDTVTIEKRLSNGYYKRPKDFLADIKRLAKDAKTIGDDDRLLKANELLSNVEVDINMMEMAEPGLAKECEQVYQREAKRQQEALAQAKEQARANTTQLVPRAVLNLPHNGPSDPSTLTTEGPINLGVPLTTGADLLARFQPVTPSKAPSTRSALTNGVHPPSPTRAGIGLSNGSSSHAGHDADAEEDTPPMGGGGDSLPTSNEKSNETQKTRTTTSYGATDSAQPRPFHSHTAPSQQLRREYNMSAPLSQTGALTSMPEGSQPADFRNEASTTQSTNGKRHSGLSSGEKAQHSTQGSGPDLFRFEDARSPGGMEIPDTQAGLEDILNPVVAPPKQNIILPNDARISKTVDEFAHQTSGLTVEQLEQVNSVLMDRLWQTRGESNRIRVLEDLVTSFNAVMNDMQGWMIMIHQL
ncbi:hypothetical protein DV737_g1579, partial [Chaetothyriales sp. CBS 132003]